MTGPMVTIGKRVRSRGIARDVRRRSFRFGLDARDIHAKERGCEGMDETGTPTEPPHWRDLLGPEIGWLSVCGFLAGQSEGPRCGAPAKWHLWLEEDQGMIGACERHVGWARSNLGLQDEHFWGTWCNLPGSIWMQAFARESSKPIRSWCEQPAGDPLAQLDLAPQPYEQELMDCC